MGRRKRQMVVIGFDIVAVLTDQNDFTKARNYWKYLKAKLKKENSQLVSATSQLKFLALTVKCVYPICPTITGLLLLARLSPEFQFNQNTY